MLAGEVSASNIPSTQRAPDPRLIFCSCIATALRLNRNDHKSAIEKKDGSSYYDVWDLSFAALDLVLVLHSSEAQSVNYLAAVTYSCPEVHYFEHTLDFYAYPRSTQDIGQLFFHEDVTVGLAEVSTEFDEDSDFVRARSDDTANVQKLYVKLDLVVHHVCLISKFLYQ